MTQITREELERAGYEFRPALMKTKNLKYYMLYRNGRPLSLIRIPHSNGREKDYYAYCIKRKTVTLSVLTYVWFKGPIPNGMKVYHKDGDIHNFEFSNLELLSHKELCRVQSLPKKWKEVLEEKNVLW